MNKLIQNLILIFAFSGLFLLPACDNNKLTDEQKAKITTEVKARVSDYIDAFSKLDTTRMKDFFAKVEGFVFAGDASLIAGWNNYVPPNIEGIKYTEKVSYIRQQEPHVFVLSEEAASYAMKYSWSMIMKTGDTVSAAGSWVYVLKKFDDGIWRVVHSAGSHIFK